VGPCAGKGSRGGQVAVSKLVLSIEQSAALIEAVLSDVPSALNACRAISRIFVVTLQGRGTMETQAALGWCRATAGGRTKSARLDSQDYLCRPPSSCQTQGVLTHQLAPGATTLALSKISSAFFLCALALQPYSSRAASLWPQSGSYQMTVRLELPHLERWGVDKTTVVCLPSSQSEGIPVPVLSANNPFAKCTATNLIIEGPKVEYDIVCPERGAAKGHAVYAFSADTFYGRIAMVMGAKNMTMTEIQHGRRIGECRRGTSVSAVKF
jgi:hypothetical protein